MVNLFKKKGNATHPLKNKKEICIVYRNGKVKFPDGYIVMKNSLNDLVIF